jgi:N-acyl-D-aspartate/D-glutamate deacylase
MRAEVEPTVKENIRRRGGAAAIVLAAYAPDHSLEGRSLAQIAADRQLAPERTALDLLARGNASIVSFNMTDRDIEAIMRQPYTMTSSDGGLVAMNEGKPHPRNYGAFARKLAVYVRERRVVSLESAIRSMTSLPAMVFRIKDRGEIREGAFADIAVFDPAKVRDRATYADPHQIAEGMGYVFVNGVMVVKDGQFTDALPGRVLRK